jgi:hypothetical protein
MRGLFTTIILIGTLISAGTSHAAPVSDEKKLTSRPSAGGAATEVKIRVVLLNLDNISGANQNFTANFAYQARWTDERLKHTGPGDERIPLSAIWHPRLQIVNRQSLQETFAKEALVSPEGEVKTVQRVWGQLSQPFALNDFPFDQQKLHLDLVGPGHHEGTVLFVADPDSPSLVADKLSISDWDVLDWSATPYILTIADGGTPLPAFRLALKVERKRGYHLVNVILPLIMIICMSWVVFWINPKNINPRVSVSVTAMLTLIAYRFAVGASLPKIAYLTRMDWFILGSSILVFTSLIEVIVTSYLNDQDRLDTACRINRWMRVLAPMAFIAIAIFSLT